MAKKKLGLVASRKPRPSKDNYNFNNITVNDVVNFGAISYKFDGKRWRVAEENEEQEIEISDSFTLDNVNSLASSKAVRDLNDDITTKLSSLAATDLSNVIDPLPANVKSQLKGDTGPAGSAGAAGSTGAQGTTGAQGATGAAGSQGPAGNNGAAGAQGSTGATGAQGSTGATGPTGPQGQQGPAGKDAVTGSFMTMSRSGTTLNITSSDVNYVSASGSELRINTLDDSQYYLALEGSWIRVSS